jgi:hypothetical protein
MMAGAGLVAGRLRARSAAAALALALAFVAVTGLLERSAAGELALNQTLLGAALGLALPLACFGLLELATGGGRIEDSVWVLARHGSSRRSVLSGVLVAIAAAGAVMGVLLSGAALIVTRSATASVWIMSLAAGIAAGVVYALWFALGSLWGKRGQGRFWCLLLDWLFGSGATFAFWPRGFVRNLALTEIPVAFEAWAGVVALSVLYASVVLLRARP